MISKFLATFFVTSVAYLAVGDLRSETEFESLQCAGEMRALRAPPDSPDHRKYAPDRKVDILHLALDVTPDFKERTIAGKVTLTFKPIAKPLDELQLDAIDLAVQSVDASEKVLGYQVTDKKVIVTFATPIPADKETRVTIEYRAEPTEGLYFRTQEMGYKPEDTHLFTQGEAIEARHWYPGYDSPNEKFTSEITCHVPEGMIVLSNGKQVSEKKDPGTGLVAVRWLQDKPHANYLVSLLAGYFKMVEDKYKDIPLAFCTPASQINQAANSFRDTKDMMAFFEQEIGVPYPWAKYYQVCVNDFVLGGMENTSITSLTDYTLFTTATENIRDSDRLVAHELAHQWFGDLVTCKDWSHLWLNEGFATYYAHLYDAHKNGRDAMFYGLYKDARGFLDVPNDTNSIVRRNFDSPDEQFGFHAYPKGSWVLQMLRSQLGEELYRQCIKTYLERHQYGNVTTEDLNAVIEELSGRSYDQFFDQWVYHAHQPELEVIYAWDEKTKLARLTIRQTQKLSENVLLFRFPLTVRFKSKAGVVDRLVSVKDKEEDFYFPLASAPEIVRLDPEFTLLAKINFNLPNPMLYAQLADRDDVVGRLIAVERLAKMTDGEAATKLKQTVNNDAFYGVRVEAARALRSIHSEEALSALLASTEQSDARARNEVVAAIRGFYGDSAYEAARKTLTEEKNPAILASAIGALGAYPKPEVRDSLLQHLNSTSYRNELADAAIGAIREQDDPVYISPVRDCLQRREPEFTTRGLARGLEALAHLARNQDKKDEVRDFITSFVSHKKKNVRLGAFAALGTLEDPRAIPVLEKFTGAAKESPERQAAEKALETLRAAKKPADDLRDLRNEVLELQKKDREMHKEIEELKKKLEATAVKPDTSKAKTKSPGTARPR